jgi:hypothetical protein
MRGYRFRGLQLLQYLQLCRVCISKDEYKSIDSGGVAQRARLEKCRV